MATMSEYVTQVGTTGLKRQGHLLFEEFLPELRERQGRAKYEEMEKNDATLRRGLRAITLQLMQPDWRVGEAEGPDAEAATEYVQQCMDDMSHSFKAGIKESLSLLTYGSSWCQVLYKRRVGPDEKDPTRRSKYTDGLWGWRKWQFKAQSTWDGWDFSKDDGEVEALKQLDYYQGVQATIPLAISLLFKFEGKLADPEGESILRSCYVPYRMKREVQIAEAIRIVRDATGLPYFKVVEGGPNLWDTSDANAVALRSYLEKAGATIRMDEQACVITPPGIEFTLVGSPGSPQVDVDKVVRRYDWQMLGSMLAQFLELGQSAHGSYGKSQSDQDFFLIAIKTILHDCIANVINNIEIPRLFRLNAGSFRRLDKLPQVVPGDLITVAFDQIATPLSELAKAGLVMPGPALEQWLRQKGGIPEEETEVAAGMVGKARQMGHEHDEEDHFHFTAQDALARVEQALNAEEIDETLAQAA